ncbi:hypothetical protein D034_4697 [Vibrio parahaemolyticus Peru-288]|nr:hypothetical protein D034_4697 [Vibrio parahaemolyticus Peru-288]
MRPRKNGLPDKLSELLRAGGFSSSAHRKGQNIIFLKSFARIMQDDNYFKIR